MSVVVASLRTAFHRNRGLAERALKQLSDEELVAHVADSGSVATIVWHLGANLKSRFTDFLTTDGEKPWREREDEFADRTVGRAELMEVWNDGWAALEEQLEGLADSDLDRTVHIRHEPMTVAMALHRALAHACYHIGQIVWMAKATRRESWEWLSIPPGGTEEHNRRMADRYGAAETG